MKYSLKEILLYLYVELNLNQLNIVIIMKIAPTIKQKVMQPFKKSISSAVGGL